MFLVLSKSVSVLLFYGLVSELHLLDGNKSFEVQGVQLVKFVGDIAYILNTYPV